jgi:hypothetical protein
MNICLAQEVLRLADLVGRVHGDKYCAILTEAQKVTNHWGTLVAHMATLSPTSRQAQQGAGKLVHVVAEFGVRSGYSRALCNEGVMIRELLRDAVRATD